MQHEHSRKEAQPPADKDIHAKIKDLEEKIKRLERIYAARQALIDQFKTGVVPLN